MRGLDIDGAGTGIKGVNILQAASVVIEHCFIRNFNGASGTGIFVNPSNFNSMLMIRDSVISHNGAAAAGAGISINTNGGSSRALINNTAVHNNFVGLSVQGTSNVQGQQQQYLGESEHGRRAQRRWGDSDRPFDDRQQSRRGDDWQRAVLSGQPDQRQRSGYDAGDRRRVPLANDPGRCAAVFRKDHAQTTTQSAVKLHPDLVTL